MSSQGYTVQQALNRIALQGLQDVSKTIGAITFTGSGLEDMTNSGVFTGTDDRAFVVEIDGTGTPDTFKWSKDGGVTYEATEVPITGSDQVLAEGITIKFEATTGHTLADIWEFDAKTADPGISVKESVEIMSEASIGAAASALSDAFDIRLLKSLALTVKCTFHASAVLGIVVEILTSPDGVNYDTEAWASTGLQPALVAGAAVQKTSNIDAKPAFFKMKITNSDVAQAVTLVEVIATKVE